MLSQAALPTQMKAWRLFHLGATPLLKDIPVPVVRPSSVLVRIEATMLPSYLQAYMAGELKTYAPPPGEFTPGGNGTGVVAAVGPDVHGLQVGQRVVLSPHFVARENVATPPQILLGITSLGPEAAPLLADWPDGTLAEYALLPVEAVTPATDLDQVAAPLLAVLNRCTVPYGGLLRGRLAAGETLVVNGATGAYGTAAVLLGLAMGASRVVAAGRNPEALAALVKVGGARVVTVALTGEVAADADALRAATGTGGAHLALDMVGNASDANATLATLNSLRRGGRHVLMGSMTSPLPISYTTMMFNNLELLGQFMYPREAFQRLLDLYRSGLLDLSAIQARTYPMAALPEAMAAAAKAGGFDCVIVQP